MKQNNPPKCTIARATHTAATKGRTPEKKYDIYKHLTKDILTNEAFVTDGTVTEAGLAALGERMPFMDLSTFSRNPRVQDFGNLMTVGDLCQFIAGKTS